MEKGVAVTRIVQRSWYSNNKEGKLIGEEGSALKEESLKMMHVQCHGSMQKNTRQGINALSKLNHPPARRRNRLPTEGENISFPAESIFPSSTEQKTTSRRLADRKIAKFQKNVSKRGTVPGTTVKKGTDYPVGPIVLGFFVFVVIGSSLFQIIRTATSGGMA